MTDNLTRLTGPDITPDPAPKPPRKCHGCSPPGF
jgi:hypothetical protein